MKVLDPNKCRYCRSTNLQFRATDSTWRRCWECKGTYFLYKDQVFEFKTDLLEYMSLEGR